MPAAPPNAEVWRRALDGDRDAFEEALAPYQDSLHAAAARLLDVQDEDEDERGDRPAVDLTPEELVGEALVRAWERRDRFDADQMGFRAWLLGLQARALARFVRREHGYASRKAISTDEELPTGDENDAVGEQFYEFRQPFDVDTYEEVLAASTPEDPAVEGYRDADLSAEDRAALADATFSELDRQAVVLHDEFAVTLPEVAQILDASLKDTAAALNLARAGLRARIGSVEDDRDDDPAVDSYTGDPLP
jgi:DNA-directed RNA polymerase specialized sigma24 family protein